MTDTLENCPFCGQANVTLSKGSFQNAEGHFYYVECTDCAAMGPEHEDGKQAAFLWNTRAL